MTNEAHPALSTPIAGQHACGAIGGSALLSLGAEEAAHAEKAGLVISKG